MDEKLTKSFNTQHVMLRLTCSSRSQAGMDMVPATPPQKQYLFHGDLYCDRTCDHCKSIYVGVAKFWTAAM